MVRDWPEHMIRQSIGTVLSPTYSAQRSPWHLQRKNADKNGGSSVDIVIKDQLGLEPSRVWKNVFRLFSKCLMKPPKTFFPGIFPQKLETQALK